MGILRVKTGDGIPIYVLPECARCAESRKNPMDMDDCPLMNFMEDDGERVCIPELCEEYGEDKNDDT